MREKRNQKWYLAYFNHIQLLSKAFSTNDAFYGLLNQKIFQHELHSLLLLYENLQWNIPMKNPFGVLLHKITILFLIQCLKCVFCRLTKCYTNVSVDFVCKRELFRGNNDTPMWWFDCCLVQQLLQILRGFSSVTAMSNEEKWKRTNTK